MGEALWTQRDNFILITATKDESIFTHPSAQQQNARPRPAEPWRALSPLSLTHDANMTTMVRGSCGPRQGSNNAARASYALAGAFGLILNSTRYSG